MAEARVSPGQTQRIQQALDGIDPQVVYVFGSKGTDREHPGSDLDLAVLSARPLDPVHRFDLSNRLSDLLGRQVDLVDLARASAVLRKEVLRTGERLLVGDPAAVTEFEMRALSDYARLNEERSAVLAR